MSQKLTVSELKQLVDRPEVVEWFDCDARDPRLLVSIKSYRKCVAAKIISSSSANMSAPFPFPSIGMPSETT
jgi:hypothetical protein